MASEATQICYMCTGFDADNKTEFFTEFVNEMQNVTDLPKPIQDRCLTSPNLAQPCDSYCVNIVATINVKNLGAFDLGTSNDSYVLDHIRAMGVGRVVIRGCFDMFLNGTNLDAKNISKMLDMGQEEVCVSGQLKISGANTDAEFCFCQSDGCNRKQPKATVAVGDVQTPINDASYTGMAAEATQICYMCTGFDADNKTEFFTEFVNEMQNVTDLPKPIQDRCLTSPNLAQPCDSYCVNIVATINVKNLGAFDLGTSNDSYVLDHIRAMGVGRVVIRGCFDMFLNGTNLDAKNISKMLDMGQEEVCVSGQLKISGANTDAEFCFCQSDGCNRKQPKATVAVGDVQTPINDASYTAACPTPRLNYTSLIPDVCTRNCTSDANCAVTNQMCCKVGGCDYLCANPVYNKPFLGGVCSQMDFTAGMLRDFYNNYTKSTEYFSDVQPYISPLSKECFNQPIKPMKNCQTLAYAFGLLTDFTKSTGQSAEQFEFLQALLENATSMRLNATFLNQLGKMSAITRGCAEETFTSAFDSGFPKIGPVSGCMKMNQTIMGIGVESQLCLCNTENCNLLSIAPQLTLADIPVSTSSSSSSSSTTTLTITTAINANTSTTKSPRDQRDNAAERHDTIKSTVILLLPVLLSYLFCQ
uniref:WAP domain-containing protein n=1 Tax=Plectus sambesii TaxID=2011161 RepID=A0A914XAV3_9BILA